MRARILSDCGGVLGEPLRLVISITIVAIALPIAWNWYDSYSCSMAEEEVRSEASELLAAARQVYFHGPGNQRVVEFETARHMGHYTEEIVIGDALPDGTNRCMVSYTMSWGAKGQLLSEPAISMTSHANAPLALGTGSYRIMAVCVEAGPGLAGMAQYVELSIVG